ncbi:Oxaloacetate decarboxylase [Caballeronia udeis]|uniref:Oxaloacetate decarboxylase n=1 Tax=Caballeronia udeis TaxID=1232866 RepID=A0A158K3N4_9BURK|nr:hypothetical protein [Caballeronia udeis]SAL75130.1 Oxaloacetate decarboxylase [Caballeronia udeis]
MNCPLKELENAGVAGLTIEECTGKLLSALDARSDPELAIVARTNVSASSDEADPPKFNIALKEGGLNR